MAAGVTAAERPLPSGFPWPNPVCPVALVPCDFGKESTGAAPVETLHHDMLLLAASCIMPGCMVAAMTKQL